MFTPLCHALAAAHDIGVVHRDLKPQNIFLAKPRRPGERFTLKILDFGIAKVLEDGRTQATGTTGTPLWMAPEQTSALDGVSPATDVWALGLLAFYLLTGKRYWLGANRARVTLPALLKELVLDDLELASVRAQKLDALSSPPKGFDTWFAHCVNRVQRDRFANAREAYMPLVSILGGVVETENPFRDISIPASPAAVLISDLPPSPAPDSDRDVTQKLDPSRHVPMPAPPAPSSASASKTIVSPTASESATKTVVSPPPHESASPRNSLRPLLIVLVLLAIGAVAYVAHTKNTRHSREDPIDRAQDPATLDGGVPRPILHRGWE